MTEFIRSAAELEDQPRSDPRERLRNTWRRRKWLGLIVFVLPFVATVTALFALPDVYRSTATVLIDRQQVPEAFVRPTVTSELETRLNTISQEILSRSRLEALITRLGLYADLRGNTSNEEIIDRMRRDIRLDLRAIGKGGATVAFALSYAGRDPQTVATVTNTLASFYIEENLRNRERQAAGTSEFLKTQLAQAKERLDEQEKVVSELRGRYLGELPQQMQANLATLESLNGQLRVNNDAQTRLADRRQALAGQLAQAVSTGEETDAARLFRLRQELTTLRMKYTELWPDIIRIKDEIARLEKSLAQPGPAPKADTLVNPASPTVQRLREAIRDTETELKYHKTDEQRLRNAIAVYQARVENTPRRELEFQRLTRDYESTKELYQSLTKRYEEAQLAESMEQRQKGEQFRILDSAVAASSPAAPKRARVLFLSLILCVGLGVGAMIGAEVLDTSFHSLDQLRAFTGVPVLVGVPRIVTDADARRTRWRFRLATVGVLLGLVVLAGGSYYVAHGNEQLVQLLLSRESA